MSVELRSAFNRSSAVAGMRESGFGRALPFADGGEGFRGGRVGLARLRRCWRLR